MKYIAILFLIALSAWGQTTVTQSLTSPINGAAWTGTITISAPSMTCSGVQYAAATTTLTVTNGTVSVALMPNDVCQVPTGLINAYKVTYRPNLGSQYTRYWLVPTSESAVSIAAIEAGGPPLAQPWTILPQSIAVGGAVNGQFMGFSGGRWKPVTLNSGSGDMTGPDVSVDGEAAVFDSTTGKALKRATATGVAKLVAGVLGVVSGSPSDCVKVDGTSGACGSGVTVANSGSSGAAVLKTGTAVTARKLVAGDNVTITENTDDITIAASGSGGTGEANVAQSFTNQTSVEIVHNASTATPLFVCYDNSVPPKVIIPEKVEATNGNTTTITFSTAQSGTCAVNSSGISGAAATVSVGGVSTGAPGSSASVTNAGNSSAAILNFVIPRGAVGETGPPGAAGATAPNNWESAEFTDQTSVVLEHDLDATSVIVGCKTSASPPVAIIPDGIAFTDANTATVTFAVAQTGKCVVNVSGGAGGSGSGDTTSVSNSGSTGASVLKTGTNVTARKIKAGTNVTVTEGTDDITIAASGSGGSGTVTAGAGLTGDGSSGDPIRMDPSGGGASQVLYSANLTGWGTIAANSCTEKNITATGAVAGESVTPGWPATLPSNLTGIIYAATNLVVVRVCNITATGIAVADGLTFSGRIIRGF